MKIPYINDDTINEIITEHLEISSKKTQYYERLKRIVDPPLILKKDFTNNSLLHDDMRNLCSSVGPSWKHKKTGDLSKEVVTIKQVQGEIDGLCRRHIGNRIGGSKSHKKDKRKTKRKAHKQRKHLKR